ncbi:hypothetical protein [Vibrio coralliilyticus]|uniref:hypothetical protein n=1 Tax=Vibrio coralliilyticus TaxID=190893 RepID=UPI00148CD828|nr:hypothetical protein [Vibrio coralliilyticus]NOI30708.1 hypothetical protein [Vibrio coralliilyticus]NOI49744.1 hypothetical protein [Vibrio coralliilyticus]
MNLRTFKNKVQAKIESNNLNDALDMLVSFVENMITDPTSFGFVLGHQLLDDLCLTIGTKSFVQLNSARISHNFTREDNTFVYLVSRLQNSGGHLRILLEMIGNEPDKNHVILCSGVVGRSDNKFLSGFLQRNRNVSFIEAPKGNLCNKLAWMQAAIVKIQPLKAFVFNHNQDSVVASALIPEMGIQSYFIHHADHSFCLGVFSRHLIHIDLHPMGYTYCCDTLRLENRYLPFSTVNTDKKENQRDSLNSLITSITIARSNKVCKPYEVSYVESIAGIIASTNGRHIHVGKLSTLALLKVYFCLWKNEISFDRFLYVPWTNNIESFLIEEKVDVYISPFPLAAGLTTIQVQSLGVPVIMHSHFVSRVNSSIELAHPDSFVWSHIEELYEYLTNLTCKKLFKEKKLAKTYVDDYFSNELFSSAIRSGHYHTIKTPPISHKYKERTTDWAIWIANESAFYLMTKRVLHRAILKIRRKLYNIKGLN